MNRPLAGLLAAVLGVLAVLALTVTLALTVLGALIKLLTAAI